ncbi:LPXTG cell wall anchor domain-containing protein [Streptomyces spinoverrucosus]|uniref:LAETG motif-containing sortase-dependent surface protein n=1 Tax=Streptomyces spinoverrucosus TaxID=284043 RepID=UPI0018C3FFCD|nr:LAETG motif-containing sortase-dependent surface protein [Streptomyces spinoverrucosus]MBG0853754.1 LPXTG cell wall anchor domain-containing protein [Streptomyces spinoverrucosus]
MSIARRVTMRRLLGTGAASLVLCAASASGAWATGSPGGGDGWESGGQYKPGTGAGTVTETDRCQFSLDGANFHDSVKVDDVSLRPTDDGKVHIKVRTAGDATTCTASLASYLAHGATFATSGEQVFIDFDTVTVKPGQTDSLDIAVPDAGCFAQVDLYRGAVKYDGVFDVEDGFEHGELPKGPDRPVIKDKLIAAWNGGTKDCTTTATQPPATTPPTPTSPPSATTPPETEEPSTPAPETTPAESEPASETPSSGSPSTEPANVPSAAGNSGDLAETGADSNTTPIAVGAAALLVGGTAIVLATRRRRASGR